MILTPQLKLILSKTPIVTALGILFERSLRNLNQTKFNKKKKEFEHIELLTKKKC